MQKLNIPAKLPIICIFLICSLPAMAQNDSVWIAYKNQFKNNLAQINDLNSLLKAGFYPGKVKTADSKDFYAGFKNKKPEIFSEISVYAKDFYGFLEGLGTSEKDRFIRYFSYLEGNFDAVLNDVHLSSDLKYLAPALSAMNMDFVQPDGKAGIWQLTHFQGVLNGLQINQLVDERFNPWLSTPAFAKVMKQNMAVFKTPELAVLAYVYGNTKMQNAKTFAGDTASLVQILTYLPQTANMLIGVYQATAVFLKANTFKATDPMTKKAIPDTVQVRRQLHFSQISNVLGIAQNELEFLNPQYRYSIVPVNGKHVDLVVPDGYWDDFVLWQDSIYNTFDSAMFTVTVQKIEYPPAPGRQYLGEPVKNLEIEGKAKIRYKLQTGDVLGVIAEKYDVEIEDLKYWNNISNERRIQAGKNIDIFVDNDKVGYYTEMLPKETTKEAKTTMPVQLKQASNLAVLQEISSGKKVEHTVKDGESPFTIAKKYEGVTPEDILKWNNIKDARKIQIGQKLIVYQK